MIFEVLKDAAACLGLTADTVAEGPFRIEPTAADAPAVDVFPLAAKGEVVLFARLGYITYEREAAYRVLLQRHYLGKDTAGAVFAIDPTTNEVVLQRAISLAGVSAEQLAGAIHAFTEMAAAASQAIDSSQQGGIPASEKGRTLK